MELDQTKYKFFWEKRPKDGKRIELIIFNKEINPVRSFHEYLGRVERVLHNGVTFVDGTLFHRVVVLNGEPSTLEPSQSFTVTFVPLYFKYKWRYPDGDEPETAFEVSSPGGGKTKRKRKRKNRKSRRT